MYTRWLYLISFLNMVTVSWIKGWFILLTTVGSVMVFWCLIILKFKWQKRFYSHSLTCIRVACTTWQVTFFPWISVEKKIEDLMHIYCICCSLNFNVSMWRYFDFFFASNYLYNVLIILIFIMSLTRIYSLFNSIRFRPTCRKGNWNYGCVVGKTVLFRDKLKVLVSQNFSHY